MSDDATQTPTPQEQPAVRGEGSRSRRRSFAIAALALGGTLIVGAAAGAMTSRLVSPHDQQALLPPVAIKTMADDSLVAVKGQAVEIFGNKFIVQDASGRALVETGREGEDRTLVAKDEAVTVQGRFEHGFVHASLVVHADGRVEELRPAGPPPHHGPKDHPWRP